MPTSGTHITVLQRLALKAQANKAADPVWASVADALGDPNSDDIVARYANLGAVGPDIFYAMMDYGPELQALETFLVKVGGAFECVSKTMEDVGRVIGKAEDIATAGAATALKDSINRVIAFFPVLLRDAIFNGAGFAGVSFWPFFEPARQRHKDFTREHWYWADYLHYIRTGVFTKNLLLNARQVKDPVSRKALTAYSLGYLTHYVTDVVGHPFVNQVVQSPWRLHWSRHHLVENHIDAYLWDRWHAPQRRRFQPLAAEPPLDVVTAAPFNLGDGAPFTNARLHDLISIGSIDFKDDPVNGLIQRVCASIRKGVAVAVPPIESLPQPNDQALMDWADIVVATLKQSYPANSRHPRNLERNNRVVALLYKPDKPRTDGYPLPEDVIAAYQLFRLVLKITTEEKVQKPQAPSLLTDISDQVQQVEDAIAKAVNGLGSATLPDPFASNGLSFDELLKAVFELVKWMVQETLAIAEAVFSLIGVGLFALSESIKYALFVVNSALFSLYRVFREGLVLAAYYMPYTDDLGRSVDYVNPWKPAEIYTFDARSLWCVKCGRRRLREAEKPYPVAEDFAERRYAKVLPGDPEIYHPYIVPSDVPGARFEQPNLMHAGPYHLSEKYCVDGYVTPDAFIEPERGDDMFSARGPATLDDSEFRNFGGALDNCARAVQEAIANPNGLTLPDYNLDGDRAYAWPCWDVRPAPDPAGANPLEVAQDGVTRVNAVRVTG